MAKSTKRKQKNNNKKVQASIITESNCPNRKKRRKQPQKRFLYSQEALEQAIALVDNNTCSLNKAAKQYGIPLGTLFNKVKRISPLKRRMGPSPVLTVEEEERLKKWILDKAEIGYPMHHTIVREAVKKVLDKIGRKNPFKNNMPGVKWLQLFLKHHPEIKNKRTEMLSRVRAAVTEPRIRAWFADVVQYLTKANALDVLIDPSRIYNLDETGVCLCPKTGKLLAPVKQKNVYCISPGQERQQITVLCCFNASGVSIRPMIMYPYKRSIPHDIINSVPDGYSIGHSDSGWMTTSSFYEYIVNCFYPQLIENGVQFPVILYFDSHSSHISIELHDFCVEKQILLYCFIAHASHIMQPLDVGVFRPLKLLWRTAVAEHAQTSNKVISKVNFAPIFHVAYAELLKKPEIIRKGFEKSGIYPFDVDKVDYSKCITHRRENMQKSLTNESDENQNVHGALSADIEKQIPTEILKDFENHLILGTEPAQEKILFSIWKKAKEPWEKRNDLNVISEDSNDDILQPTANVPSEDSNDILQPTANVPSEDLNDNVLQPTATILNKDLTGDILECTETAVIPREDILKLDDQNIEYFDHSLLVDNVLVTVIDCENVQNSDSAAVVNLDGINAKEDNSLQVNVDNILITRDENANEVLEKINLQKDMQGAKRISVDDREKDRDEIVSTGLNIAVERKINFEDEVLNDSGVIPEPLDKKTISQQQYEILDLSIKSQIEDTASSSSTTSALNHNILLNPYSSSVQQLPSGITPTVVSDDFSKIVGNDINIKKELLDQHDTLTNSDITQVWKQHLHFPRIETSKLKKTKAVQAPIYAMTSDRWKMEYLKKIEEEERLKREKEEKKRNKEAEKLLKQKIKQEEVEIKKKTREEEKVRKKKIKKEEAEYKQKQKLEEKLKRLEEKKNVQEEYRQSKKNKLWVRKKKRNQPESSTVMEPSDLAFSGKENSLQPQLNVQRSADSSSPSKKKTESILQETNL